MPTNKLMWAFVVADFVFVASGATMLGFVLISESSSNEIPTIDNVANHLLLKSCPLTAAIVNSVFIFITFLVSLPALVMRQNKGWLRAHGWMTVVCALFTLILGLVIWFQTLQTRSELLGVWANEAPRTQGLLQQKFNCCGYLSFRQPPFVQDSTCPNRLAAAQKQGCITPFSNFANQYLDVVFTGFFGMVGVDALLLLCTVCVLKYREEQERYRHIDEKNVNRI